jgi:hypothetical protein
VAKRRPLNCYYVLSQGSLDGPICFGKSNRHVVRLDGRGSVLRAACLTFQFSMPATAGRWQVPPLRLFTLSSPIVFLPASALQQPHYGEGFDSTTMTRMVPIVTPASRRSGWALPFGMRRSKGTNETVICEGSASSLTTRVMSNC